MHSTTTHVSNQVTQQHFVCIHLDIYMWFAGMFIGMREAHFKRAVRFGHVGHVVIEHYQQWLMHRLVDWRRLAGNLISHRIIEIPFMTELCLWYNSCIWTQFILFSLYENTFSSWCVNWGVNISSDASFYQKLPNYWRLFHTNRHTPVIVTLYDFHDIVIRVGCGGVKKMYRLLCLWILRTYL